MEAQGGGKGEKGGLSRFDVYGKLQRIGRKEERGGVSRN